MESKTVKIIDEHGIDRNANVVCGFKVDGLDYVLYWIERDGDNDNLFTSKVVKNIDGTFSMVNIEDNMEKGKVTELVKKLVTFAINDDAAAVTNGAVTLSDGTKVDVFPTLFNKEQNINVSKTYITTVKKSVTKVSEDFYKVKNEGAPVEQPFFDAVKEEIQLPEIDNAITSAPEVAPEPIPEPIPEPAPEPVAAPAPEPVVPEISVVPPVLETPEVKAEPSAPEEIVIPDFAASIPAVPEAAPAPMPEPVAAPVVPEPVMPAEPAIPEPAPAAPEVAPIFEASAPEVAPAPMPAPVAEPTSELVLDGSKETNLVGALGEANADAPIPVSDVSALREFGQSDTQPPVEAAPVPGPSKAAGFANNKYFLIVAFVFFIASCAFLGYEVFRYLQVK